MPATKTLVFRFANVEVREREFSLTKAGEVLPVEPKAFRVLLALLRNPGKLIGKEELLNAVWGDAAVTDNSLARSVALLRRLLEDETRNPRYIETVATVGYRFVCKVEVSEDATAGLDRPEEPEDPANLQTPIAANLDKDSSGKLKRGSRQGLRWWLLSGAGILAAGLAALVWYLHRPLPPPHISAFTQITNDGRMKCCLGTDGNRIYFTQLSPSSVAQVATTGGEVAQIPIAVPGRHVVLDVSRDGSRLLIASSEEGHQDATLWNVPVLGGAARRLGVGLISGAFSPDGNSVAYATPEWEIYRVQSDGTGARKLAAVGGLAFNIAWSPDGGSIRFQNSRDGRLWEISSDGASLHPLLPGWRGSSRQCCGHWTPDGRFYLFHTGRSASLIDDIWALDERRGLFRKPPTEPIQLTTGPFRWSFSIPSRDGKKIFANGMAPRVELVRLDQQTRQAQPFLGGISAEFVTFSKDGRFVAYVSFPEGILWRANRDGSNPVQLSEPPMYPLNPRWSPDGTSILFSDRYSKSYIVSAEGGSPQPILPEDAGSQADPNWSPDGRKIAFSPLGFWGPKNENLRILDLASHQVTTVPGSVGVWSPRWSPNGRYLAALSPDPPMLRIFDMETQHWSALPVKGNVGFPCFSRDSQSIYFLRYGVGQGVFRIRLKGGKPEEKTWDLKDLHVGGYWGFSMSLDPTDTPLVSRDIGSQDIYALTLEEK
jgi:Tol biopolymer transport system component/DNA-binding winged helix-turn-helix (wHTH) protein